MSHRRYRGLRKLSYELAATHLLTLLPEGSPAVPPEDVKLYEATQEGYIWKDSTRLLAPYSSKWFYRKLKKELK